MIFYACVILIVLYLGRKRIKAYVIEYYGREYLPKNNRFLWLGFVLGCVGGIVGSMFDLQGKDRASNSDEIIGSCFAGAILGIIVLAIINACRHNKGKGFWTRYWCNSFLFLVTFFPGVLLGSLMVWGAVLVVLAMAVYHGIGSTLFGTPSGGAAPKVFDTLGRELDEIAPGLFRDAEGKEYEKNGPGYKRRDNPDSPTVLTPGEEKG